MRTWFPAQRRDQVAPAQGLLTSAPGTAETVRTKRGGVTPMADDTARKTKLTQYLTEAYGKEKELETALEAHIGMTTRMPYKKRLREHLRETKSHAKQLERQLKKVSGEGPSLISKAATEARKAVSLAKGPTHMLRGTGEAEKMLKNAKTEYWNEHEEIATYTSIEALAEALKESDIAKMARAIRRDEERMAKFLERQIPTLTKAVVQEEIPRSQRSPDGASASRSRRTSRSGAKRSGSSRSGSSRSGSSRSGSSRSGSSRSSGSRSTRSRSNASRTRAGSRTTSRASSSRSRASGGSRGRAGSRS